MQNTLTMSLINNATLLLVLSIVYELSYLLQRRLKRFSGVFSGLIIGLICILIMTFPFQLRPGLVFDTRSILISVSALTFGFIPSAIAAAVAIIYRLFMGGIGTATGCMVIATSFLIGLITKRLGINKGTTRRWFKIYLMGIIVHVCMLACMFLLPLDTAMNTVKTIALPVLIIYPIGVVLLCLLLIRQNERNEALLTKADEDSRYRSLFNNNHEVMLIINPENGNIVDANPAAIAFYGWPPEVIKQKNISQINTLSPNEIKIEMAKAMARRRNYFLFKHNRSSGPAVDVEVYSGPITIDGKQHLYSIVHDISARITAEKELRDSEERFRELVDHAPDAIFVMIEGHFAFVNNAGLTLLGASRADELLGKPGMSVIHPDHQQNVYKYIARLRAGYRFPEPVERVYIRLDGTLVDVDVIVVPITYTGVNADLIYVRNISERKRLQQQTQQMEAQQRQQQKLEAIGTLAGGVAHEINNPLNGIMNYAQLILDACEPESSSAVYSNEIIHETERISEIVKNLLQFSRHEKQSHSYASMYDIIGKTLSLVNTILRKDQIQLDIQLDADLPDLKCRNQQIQQVFMNLLTNARDALNAKYPEYDENKVIQVRCILIEADQRRWLRLTVRDNGIGIQKGLGDRIFEPFFSTKPKDVGTGLGLSISYGIISEHHGKISFESEPGQYTVFTLDLPVDNGWELEPSLT